MKLSLSTIALCRMKYGKGLFYGFEQLKENIFDELSEVEMRKDFEQLTKEGMIGLYSDDIHITALGQHIFNMMLEPEQYILLKNEINEICIRMYIRNVYYLCVIQDSKLKKEEEYILKLLPRLELVSGSFTYVLYPNEKENVIPDKFDSENIVILRKTWDKNRKISSEIKILGRYCKEGIFYRIMKNGEESVKKSEISDLINVLVKWTFKPIQENPFNEITEV